MRGAPHIDGRLPSKFKIGSRSSLLFSAAPFFFSAFDSHVITKTDKRKVKGKMEKGTKQFQYCGGHHLRKPLKRRPPRARLAHSRKISALLPIEFPVYPKRKIPSYPANSNLFQPIPALKKIIFSHPIGNRFQHSRFPLSHLLLLDFRRPVYSSPKARSKIKKLPNEPICHFFICP